MQDVEVAHQQGEIPAPPIYFTQYLLGLLTTQAHHRHRYIYCDSTSFLPQRIEISPAISRSRQRQAPWPIAQTKIIHRNGYDASVAGVADDAPRVQNNVTSESCFGCITRWRVGLMSATLLRTDINAMPSAPQKSPCQTSVREFEGEAGCTLWA